MISGHFTTATREEFINLATSVADASLAALKIDPSRPRIISITGHTDAGKSAYWDVFANHLLDKGGIFVATKSESTEKLGRFHETWVGENHELQRSLTLCFCNARGAGPTNLKEPYISLIRGDYKKLGDILVLTNAPKSFITEENRFIDIEVLSIDDHPSDGWNRSVSISCNLDLK